MANIFEPEFDPADAVDRPGFTRRRARLGRQAAAEHIGASVYELPPGEAIGPYHWHSGNEEMVIALSGRPSVRTPEGWRELEPGEVVPFPRGPRGAHQVANRGDEVSRVLLLGELNGPDVIAYPDSNKGAALSRPPGGPPSEDDIDVVFRFADEVDYFLDEEPPGPE